MDGAGRCGVLEGYDTQSICSALGSGEPLSAAVSERFQAASHPYLANVRVHADQAADRFAKYLGAEAFAIRGHVVFRRDRFRPNTPEGWKLLCHELGHVPESGRRKDSIFGWFTWNWYKGKTLKYVLHRQPQEYLVTGNNWNTHRELTQRALKEAVGFGSGAQEKLLFWVEYIDGWKEDGLGRLADDRAGKGFRELKCVVANAKDATAVLHCYNGHTNPPFPAEIGLNGPYGAGLTGKGLVGSLLKSAVINFNNGNDSGRENALILLGISLHTIQDFFSHKAPLFDKGEDLRELGRREGQRIGEPKNYMVLEDDATLDPSRMWRAKDRTLNQLQAFWYGLTDAARQALLKMSGEPGKSYSYTVS